MDFIVPVSTARFGFTVATSQQYQATQRLSPDDELVSFKSVTNSVQGSDVAPATSSQNYTSFDSDGNFYNCQIATQKNTLTSVSQGCTPEQD